MKWLVAVAVVVALAVGAGLYFRAGWSGMETACASNGPGDPSRVNVSYSWEWNPIGFTCTYADGSQETSLWF